MVQPLRPTPALHRYVLALCVLGCLAVGLVRKPPRKDAKRAEIQREQQRESDKRWATNTTRAPESLLRRIHKLRD